LASISVSAALLAAIAAPAVACDLCAVYSAAEARGEIGRGFFAGVSEQFTRFGTLQQDGHEVPNEANQWLDSSITQLFAGYNFSSRVGVQFTAPLIVRSFQRPQGLALERGTESGLGDLLLTGHFIPVYLEEQDWTFDWHLLAGVKLPTGDTARLAEEENEVEVPGAPESGIHGHDLTLGSGSVDGIVGTSVACRWQRLFLNASAQYAIRSEGDFDYQFANDLTWAGGPGYLLVLKDDYTLSLQANVSGESKGKDTFAGVKADDTAITSVFLGPELLATWKDKLSIELGVDWPVSIDNSALQIVPDYRLRAAFSWHF
jgi:hypothetical protein